MTKNRNKPIYVARGFWVEFSIPHKEDGFAMISAEWAPCLPGPSIRTELLESPAYQAGLAAIMAEALGVEL